MLTTADLLSALEEPKTTNVKRLAKKLEVQPNELKEVLKTLSEHNIVKYDQKTGEVALPKWLINIDKKIESIKPAVGEIILPKFQEIRIQDITIGNYTRDDLELKIRLKAKQKEIAICNIT